MVFSPKYLDTFATFIVVTCHISRHFSHVRSYRDTIAKTFRPEYFGKKMSREKRRISDGGGGYEKHLNEILLALGCMAWQSDTPPTSNRVIRRLTEPSSRPTTFYDRLPAPLADLLITPRAKKEFATRKGGRTNANNEADTSELFCNLSTVITLPITFEL